MAEDELYQIGLQLGRIIKRLSYLSQLIDARLRELRQGIEDVTKGASHE